MAPDCGTIQLGRVFSGMPLRPVLAVGSGLSLSASPTCSKKATAFVGAVCHAFARSICSGVGVYWPGSKYFGRCPRASNSTRVLRPKRSTTLSRIEATEVGSLAGTSESARIRMSIQSRFVSNGITR